MTLHVLGFRGKTGRIEKVRSDGSCDVRLDDSSTIVRRVPPGKLAAVSDS